MNSHAWVSSGASCLNLGVPASASILVLYTMYIRVAKILANLHIGAGSSELQFRENAKRAKIPCVGSFG